MSDERSPIKSSQVNIILLSTFHSWKVIQNVHTDSRFGDKILPFREADSRRPCAALRRDCVGFSDSYYAVTRTDGDRAAGRSAPLNNGQGREESELLAPSHPAREALRGQL
jgi:hypothetical protein